MRFLTFCFILFQIAAFAQNIGFSEIEENEVKPWKTQKLDDYLAVYHFGDSETESDLIILQANQRYFAQIRSARWDEKANWIWQFENLKNVHIEGNKFYSDKTNGEFVEYKKTKGLKVLKPWSGVAENGRYEIGLFSFAITNYFNGKYSIASMRFLTEMELKKMTKNELRIMRNEIFARYGFIFSNGSEMDKYFKKQTWYNPQHIDIGGFLTELEKENIKLIESIEKIQSNKK